MKTNIKLLLVVGMFISLFSCTTSQKITVYGVPETEIYTPNKVKLASIDNTGKAEIKLPSDGYYGLLLSHNKTQDTYIPFALDYKRKNYLGCRAAMYGGLGLSAAGLVPLIAGTVAVLAGDEEVGGLLAGIGGGAVLVGTGFGMPATSVLSQTQQTYRFAYLDKQSTNEDLSFTSIVEEKLLPVESQSTSPRKIKTDGKGSKSNRTLNNLGKMVSGVYEGSGTLHQENEIVESYESIKIEITRIDNNNVQVNVIEGGESFFNSVSTYSVKKDKRNNYVLSLKGNSSATIKIDVKGKLSYYHPKVNIEGENYILKIIAKK